MKLKLLLINFLIINFVVGQDFEVSPLNLYFSAEPGESQTKFLSIKNHSDKVETFILSLSDVSINSKGQGIYEEAGSMKNSIADWITFAPSFFELNPNEEKEVSLTLQQPTDEYGSKWGVVFVRTATEQTAFSADKGVSAGINLSARIAVNIYQTPGTNKSYKATITNMSEITGSKDSIRTFNAVVNNLSDVITGCKVFLIATNIETGEEFQYDDYDFTMYPKSSRKIELYLEEKLPKGTYSLAGILDYGSRTNLEGVQMIIKVD